MRPQLATPAGLLPANCTGVAIGADDDVYLTCAVAYHGAQATGVSQYALNAGGKLKLVRSFCSFNLPERPIDLIAVDRSNGAIYVASSGQGQVVFVFAGNTANGEAHPVRGLAGGKTGLRFIESLALDHGGRLYVATPGGVLVFGPTAKGDVKPQAVLVDPKHLQFSAGETGNYLAAT